jgi:hypothetical protein
MVRCLATRKSIHDGVKFVKSCPEVSSTLTYQIITNTNTPYFLQYKSSLGKGRALIRFCLVHQCLADTMQQCISDGEVTSMHYKANSPLLRHELSADLIDCLYILNEITFNLNPTGHDLDVAWPTFSKWDLLHFHLWTITYWISVGLREAWVAFIIGDPLAELWAFLRWTRHFLWW